ncbi:RNA polymerase sigma factor [Streptacidiphilus sp. MAP5-3]|uniref:RNA polymerase sigma factor n=1 Tax=unclassified Streptacidiphilus TaxID=2643834 RepID=UPI0035183F09
MDLASALDGARHGDEQAFRVLYRAVHPPLLRYLRVLVGEDAEDVASETWLQIVRDLPRFRGDGERLQAWCLTVARHRALDHLRTCRRRPLTVAGPEALIQWPGPDDTAGSALDALATTSALELIACLPADQAEAVYLRVVLGLDARHAARVLGKRPGAVRTAAHRGLRRLATLLDPAPGGAQAGPAARALSAVQVVRSVPSDVFRAGGAERE